MTLGNPAPFGLLAFGMTTAMLMFVDMGWAETEFEEMVCGYAIFYGGLMQFVVAIAELCKGSSFSFAAFGSYGAFWLGWGLVFLQNNSVASTFGGSAEYQTGKTLWFAQWGILTFCFWIITLRKNICLIVVFGLLSVTFFFLAAATGSGNVYVKKTAGYVGFATALAAWYTAVAELVNEEWGRHVLPGLAPLIQYERFVITKNSIMKERMSYDATTNTLFLKFRGLQIKTVDDVNAIKEGVEGKIMEAKAPDNKVHLVADYENVTIANAIVDPYWAMIAELQDNYYLSARRFHVTSFGTPSGKSTALNLAESMRKFDRSTSV